MKRNTDSKKQLTKEKLKKISDNLISYISIFPVKSMAVLHWKVGELFKATIKRRNINVGVFVIEGKLKLTGRKSIKNRESVQNKMILNDCGFRTTPFSVILGSSVNFNFHRKQQLANRIKLIRADWTCFQYNIIKTQPSKQFKNAQHIVFRFTQLIIQEMRMYRRIGMLIQRLQQSKKWNTLNFVLYLFYN